MINDIRPRLLPVVHTNCSFSFDFFFFYFSIYVRLVRSYFRITISLSSIQNTLSILHKNSCLIESQALTRSTYNTQASCLYSYNIYNDDFNANVASVQPFLKSDQHCSSIPKITMCLVRLVAIIEEINFIVISHSTMSLHLFAVDRFPIFQGGYTDGILHMLLGYTSIFVSI